MCCQRRRRAFWKGMKVQCWPCASIPMGIIASAAAKTGLFASGILTGVFTSKPTKVMPETFGMLLLRGTLFFPSHNTHFLFHTLVLQNFYMVSFTLQGGFLKPKLTFYLYAWSHQHVASHCKKCSANMRLFVVGKSWSQIESFQTKLFRLFQATIFLSFYSFSGCF
jgi:hypothetical protein